MFLATMALLVGERQTQGGLVGGLIAIFPFFLIIAVFYLIVFLPQRKKEKLHRQMIDSMKRGDQVITSGGIHGTVVDVRDDTVVICISKGVNIKVSKPSIANVQSR